MNAKNIYSIQLKEKVSIYPNICILIYDKTQNNADKYDLKRLQLLLFTLFIRYSNLLN